MHPLALLALLAASSPADALPLGDADVLVRDCDVTIQARNEFVDHAIVIQLSESEVRVRRGTWAKFLVADRPSIGMIGPPPGHGHRRVYPQGTLSVTETLPLACNRERRYRLRISVLRPEIPIDSLHYYTLTTNLSHVVEQDYTLYHPSADGFTQDPVLRLGDLSRLFPGLEDRPSGGDPVASGSPSGSGGSPDPLESATGDEATPPTWVPPASEGFVPGARTLFASDFRGVAVGAFPDVCFYGGGAMQVVSHGGRPMLEMDREGWFHVPLPDALPDRFTIEFLYHSPHRFATLLFAPYDPATATRPPSSPHYRPVRAHHFILTLESNGNGVRPGLGAGDLPHAVRVSRRVGGAPAEAYVDGPVRIQAVVDGERATLFVDGERVAHLPRAGFERAAAVEFYYKGGRGPAYVGDIRITGDGPTRDDPEAPENR